MHSDDAYFGEPINRDNFNFNAVFYTSFIRFVIIFFAAQFCKFLESYLYTFGAKAREMSISASLAKKLKTYTPNKS